MSFDWEMYSVLNPDLKQAGLTTQGALEKHFFKLGTGENRKYSIYHLYPDFNPEIYRKNYSDLQNMNKRQLELHWLRNGRNEGRTYIDIDSTKPLFSIVMAYFNNRKVQILKTLDGFRDNYCGKYNFEVVIVDDNSSEENCLRNIISNYNYPIQYIYIDAKEKGDRINPCVPYNIGFKRATGKYIIIQNPECYHAGDILAYTRDNLNDTNYLTFSCFSGGSFELTDELLSDVTKVTDDVFLYKNMNISPSSLNWYNHPTNNKTDYHFCSAITKYNLNLLGGFDEAYAGGYCFDDDDFLLEIKYKLKLNVITVGPNKCFVIHQFHTSIYLENNSELSKKNKQLWIRNNNLFIKKQKKFGVC